MKICSSRDWDVVRIKEKEGKRKKMNKKTLQKTFFDAFTRLLELHIVQTK